MEIKFLARRYGVETVLIIIAFLMQTSVLSNFELAGVAPNVLLAVVSTYGFMKGRRKGMSVGFFCGLLLDFFSGNYFGMMALIYMYLGYINGFFKKVFFGDDLRLPLVLIGTTDFIYGYVMFAVNRIFVDSTADIVFYTKNLILPEMVYTILVGIFVYYAILKLDAWLEKAEKKRGYGRFNGAD